MFKLSSKVLMVPVDKKVAVFNIYLNFVINKRCEKN